MKGLVASNVFEHIDLLPIQKSLLFWLVD